MTDKVHPATKPNATAAAAAAAPIPKPPPSKTQAAAAAPIPKPPPSKTQLHNPRRHPHRPPPTSKHLRKDRRRRFCLACFWFTLLLVAILILASIAAAAFYILYHPHKPLFSVTSLKISSFNLTTIPSDDTTHLSTKLNLTLSAKNPNKKIAFLFDPMSITVQSNSVKLSNGSFTKFTNSPDTIFIIHTAMWTNSQVLETESANSLKSDIKKRNGLPMSIVVDTMVGIKIEKLKMKKIGIRVNCEGIRGVVPKGKHVNSTVANVSKAKCKAGLRIKIF